MPAKSLQKTEFGDFQTPRALASQACAIAASRLPSPGVIIEPTCGIGNFLVESERRFKSVRNFIGVETNKDYITKARSNFRELADSSASLRLKNEDFFQVDWKKLLQGLEGDLLVIGNPPWVTSSELGTFSGKNLPRKTNSVGLSGLDALTGKSNFDISEWMCVRLLETLPRDRACFALLLKTAVARRVLQYAWKNELPLTKGEIYRIDAKRHFDATVDACLFLGQVQTSEEKLCPVYPSLESRQPESTIGYEDGKLVANSEARLRTSFLTASRATAPMWRSGVKHDCSKVLELRPTAKGELLNGFGEAVDIEDEFLFPLQKSSDVAASRADGGKRIIVTQRSIGESTESLATTAPRLWKYLNRHGAQLDNRKSSIYRGKPRFSIFGVGDYTFAPWKVAISGLYKRLDFSLQGPVSGKPVVFDDTVYFLPFKTEQEAAHAHHLVSTQLARSFFSAFIFWDAKRPVTAALLRRLCLEKLSMADFRLDLA